MAELEHGASGSGHPAPRSTQQDALGPCSTSRALKGNTKGTVALPWPRAPAVRPGSAWELGAAAGSRSVTEHGSGGTVMAAGSSTAPLMLGSAGLGRGHQRTVSTQQPLARKLPGCPIPSASSSHHSDRPDIVLAMMG